MVVGDRCESVTEVNILQFKFNTVWQVQDSHYVGTDRGGRVGFLGFGRPKGLSQIPYL